MLSVLWFTDSDYPLWYLQALPKCFHVVLIAWMCTQSVRTWLHAFELHTRKSILLLQFIEHNRNCHLRFVRRHANWGVLRIRHNNATGESRFCSDFHNGHSQVCRQKKVSFENCCVTEHDQFDGDSIIVWRGIN